MSVVIRRDGQVEDITVQGADEQVHAAVSDIVHRAEPFAPIPQAGEGIDQLIITRTWVFEPGKRIATEEPPAAMPTDLRRRYADALLLAVREEWNTLTAPRAVKCHVGFTQIPGGEVIAVEFADCAFNESARRDVEAALRAHPMPYFGFEPVFQRQVRLTLCHPEEACQ